MKPTGRRLCEQERIAQALEELVKIERAREARRAAWKLVEMLDVDPKRRVLRVLRAFGEN